MKIKETLKQVIEEEATCSITGEISSSNVISAYVKSMQDNQHEVNELLHYLKNIIKKEVIKDLDKQIETFKHFQRCK